NRIGGNPEFPLQFVEKAAFASSVTGNTAHLFNRQQQHVAIAIGVNRLHFLEMAGLLALAPEPLARARPVYRVAAAHRFLQGFAIHVGEHHDPPVLVLGDGRHHAVGVPFQRLQPIQGMIEIAHKRTSIPRPAINSLAWRTVYSPKWKIEAARTASARPSVTPSAKCCRLPTPPEAMTGILTASETARVSARSKPFLVPSRSMLVSRISPAPSCSTFFAHSTVSSPVSLRPPWVKTCHLPGATCLASMATTMHCEPTLLEALKTRSGSLTAAVFIDTLSAPALSRRRTSSTLRTPPPTVSGMKTCSAQASTMCRMMSRWSLEAVMSRNVTSSAPCSS